MLRSENPDSCRLAPVLRRIACLLALVASVVSPAPQDEAFVRELMAPGRCEAAEGAHAPAPECFSRDFRIDECTFTTTGRNAYFVLEPGYRLVLAGSDDGEPVELAITVLDETREVDGVQTRVLEEREWEDGEITEVSRDFLAICRETGDVVYFGEEVDVYEDGELVSHHGEWLAGQEGARPGLLMPARPLLGARFHQEIAPGRAMDRAHIVADDVRLQVPAGTFDQCLAVIESSPLEPGSRELKVHAPGVGILHDENLRLVEYGAGTPP